MREWKFRYKWMWTSHMCCVLTNIYWLSTLLFYKWTIKLICSISTLTSPLIPIFNTEVPSPPIVVDDVAEEVDAWPLLLLLLLLLFWKKSVPMTNSGSGKVIRTLDSSNIFRRSLSNGIIGTIVNPRWPLLVLYDIKDEEVPVVDDLIVFSDRKPNRAEHWRVFRSYPVCRFNRVPIDPMMCVCVWERERKSHMRNKYRIGERLVFLSFECNSATATSTATRAATTSTA